MEKGGLHIGEGEEGDLAAVLEIERDSFPSPWSRELFRSEFANPASRILFARTGQGGQVAGYLVFWRVADEIQLHNIAVRRELRRSGIAARLLAAAIRRGRSEGARLATLEVRRTNLPALKLYEGFGFTLRGVRRGYYTDTGEDALILSADLPEIP